MIGVLLAKRAIVGSFDALNRHDLPRFLSGWRDDGVFIYPGEVPESGSFQGKSAVEAWFRRFFEQFPKIRFEIREICFRNGFDLTGNNVAAVHWDLQLTNREGRTGKNSGVTVVTIRGGKVLAAKDYLFDTGEEYRGMWGAT
jgi:ketosteroid isomerase-like protein